MNNDETTRRGALRSVPRSLATLRTTAISPREQGPIPTSLESTQIAAQPAYEISQTPEPQVEPEMAPVATSDPIAPPVSIAPPYQEPTAELILEPVIEPLAVQPVALSTSQLLPPPLPVEPIMRPISAEPVVLHPLSQATQLIVNEDTTSRNPVRFQDVLVKSAPKAVQESVVPTPVTQDDLLDEPLSFPDSGSPKPPVVQEEKKSFLKRIFKRS